MALVTNSGDNDMKLTLRARLTLMISLISLISVVLVSVFASYTINQEFKRYITTQQEIAINDIVSNLSQQYDDETQNWDVDFIHTIGMYALNEGYIIKVSDLNGTTLWDAETWDMSACVQLRDEVTHRMLNEFPGNDGSFGSTEYPLAFAGKLVGSVNMTYFGPYFYDENDFRFLQQLKSVLIAIALSVLLVSILIGSYFAKRLSQPIYETISATDKISRGDYGFRIQDSSDVREVDDLIRSVNAMAHALEKQEQLKRQLTSDVAHELRTPLTTLQTTTEAMIEGLWEPTKERLESNMEEVKRITTIVKDLESLASVEGGNLVLKKIEVSLPDITAQVLKNLSLQIEERGMTVLMAGTCPNILADPDRMIQVIYNLVNNAIKYTQEKGQIRIDFSEGKDQVNLSISDNGYGIPSDELPYIFERFYRADKSRNRDTGGSGIGLAIVKSIIQAHQGEIEAISTLDVGSTFTVRLPKKS